MRNTRRSERTVGYASTAVSSTTLSGRPTLSVRIRNARRVSRAIRTLAFASCVSDALPALRRCAVAFQRRPDCSGGPLRSSYFVADSNNSLNKQTDAATGWSYHGARWVAPETGRWLTPDPPAKAPQPKFLQDPWALHPYQYVHQNPVKHGLVTVANQYPWCSAAWFERESSPAIVKSIYRFKTDRVSVEDDFAPALEW